MVTGQTLANMLSVPAGTLLAEYLNWRLAFIILALGAGLTIVLTLAWMPLIAAVPDAGLAGRFRFLAKPGPWLVLGTVFVGNSGVFCWWSYVSPWLQKTGGYDSQLIPLLMMLAGFGMVVGGLAGGHLADRWLHSVTAAVGQSISAAGLLMVFIVPGNLATCALLTFWIAFGLFFINGPQMLLMAEAGKDGGELIGGAAVQIAFNGGNAVGSLISGMALNASGMNYHTIGLAGLPFTLAAVGLLVMFALLYERKKAQ
ncbi:arabinose polymer MFS transporter [Bifidobacterium saguini DSM 23967]|uniref:Arabinose polymer MFS transporter n=1 Tax=Bifidobacterium saguini DSM 23967 TaxID=1437607 RepID=A0A087DA36_9BIFI|nr:arabinose polymer MFS transporter [Bifidobacterium saguini DSM 23967]